VVEVTLEDKRVAIQIRRFQNNEEVEMSLNEQLQKQLPDLGHQVEIKPTPSWGECSNTYMSNVNKYILCP
jgi:hypothetical protein